MFIIVQNQLFENIQYFLCYAAFLSSTHPTKAVSGTVAFK